MSIALQSTKLEYLIWTVFCILRVLTSVVIATFPKAASKKGYRPAKGSIAGFGLANALGGYMIFDGDLVNGSGFVSGMYHPKTSLIRQL